MKAPRPNVEKLFNLYDDEKTGTYLTEKAVDWITKNKENPFFLYFSPFAVHSNVKNTPQHYRDRIPGGNGTAYEGAVLAVDDAVGKLLTMLKKHKLEEDTLIFFTGDNGANRGHGGSSEPYRGGKGPDTQQEGWVHTPTIISWPGTIPAGVTYDGLTATIDFYATMAAAAGLAVPERCDGENLLPYLNGKKSGDAHEFIFWHNADPTDEPRRNLYAVRWKDWRMVKHPDGWHLYDLKKDPKEMKNVASKNAKVVDHMHDHYEEFVATLPPIKPSVDFKGGGQVPKGWGWAIGEG